MLIKCDFRQQDLLEVLKSFSILNPEVGYCQAQAPIAAFLLMHMPAEEAFWCLVSICDKYLSGYYSQGMVGCTTVDLLPCTIDFHLLIVSLSVSLTGSLAN